MPKTDIGPRIGLDGEKEFRSSLSAISSQLKSLGSEMKAVTAEFQDNESSMEALTKKADVLNRSIAASEQQMKTLSAQYDRQTSQLDELAAALEKAQKEFGENSTQASKAQIAYNKQYKTVQSLQTQLNTTRTAMAQMRSQLSEVEGALGHSESAYESLTKSIGVQQAELDRLRQEYANAVLAYGKNSKEAKSLSKQVTTLASSLKKSKNAMQDAEQAATDLGKEVDDAADAMGHMEKSSSGLGSSLRDAFLGGGIAGAIQSMVSGIKDLVEGTTEYRRIMASLEVSSERAGYTAEETAQTYRTLYGVLGDDQTAATTTSNLQAIGLAQKQLNDITNAAIGAWATYGDSIPIDGLAEAINETIQVGQVTGTFADALNWAGVSEDEFNARLEGIQDPAERANLVLQQLASQGLVEAGEAWQQNNADIVAANQATASLSDTMARFGTALSPVVTTVKAGFADLLASLDIEGMIASAMETLSTLYDRFVEIGSYLSAELAPLNESLINLWSTLVTVLEPVIHAIQQYITTGEVSNGVTTALHTAFEILSNTLSAVIDALASFISWLDSGTPGAEAFKAVIVAVGTAFLTWNVIQSVSSMISSLISSVKTAKTAFAAFSAVLSANPIGIVVTALAALTAAFVYLWNNCEEFREFWIDLFESVKSAIASAGEAISDWINDVVQWFSDVVQSIRDTWGSLVDFFSGLLDSVLNVFSDVFDRFQSVGSDIQEGIKAGVSGIVNIGHEIIEGLWKGINDMASWIGEKIRGFGENVLNGIKDFFGIHSPSKVMRNEVGVMLPRGMAQGMDDGIKYVERAAKDVGTAIEDEIAKVNGEISRMQKEESERQAQNELSEYKRNLAKKYEDLGKAELDERQDILDEISNLQADWNEKQAEEARKAEQSAAQARLEELEEFQKKYQDTLSELEAAYQDSHDEITGMQMDMAGTLSGYGDLFTEAENIVELGDLQAQIDDIRQYGEALRELEARGISDSLMDEITGMSVEDALKYTNELLNLTDEQYDEYMSLWEEKQSEAQRVAKEFYASELQALNDEYVTKLPDAISGLRDEMAELGMDSALGLAEGFASMAGGISGIFTDTIQQALNATKSAMGIHSPSTVWRDDVGRYMAQGIGVGFEDEMGAVASRMQRSIPTPTVSLGDELGRLTSALSPIPQSTGAQTINLSIELDGAVLARKQYKYNARESTLRGASLVEVPTL